MSDVVITPGAPPNSQIANAGGVIALGACVACQGLSGTLLPAGGSNVIGAFSVLGIATEPATLDEAFYYQYTGTIQLTPAQWEAITDGASGMEPGSIFYASPTTPGNLTSTKPTASGTYVNVVGVGLSTTLFQIIPAQPVGPHA